MTLDKKRKAPILLVAALLAVGVWGCASLGIGTGGEKPQGATERFLALVSDYTGLARELTITVDGWTQAIEQGDPNADLYLAAAKRIEQFRERARQLIDTTILAMLSGTATDTELDVASRALESLIGQLQAEMLTGGTS